MGIQPPWCDADPPAKVSSYCDGSVSNPSQKTFALGGSGVWHKGRSEQEEPITEYEMQFLKMCFTADGCEGLHRDAGHDVDSYRTEVLGVLAAMGMHGGVHFGLDNHAAFEDVMRSISKPVAETAPRKPWSLLNKGDLLERVHVFRKPKIAHLSSGLGGGDTVLKMMLNREKFRGIGESETRGRMH